MINGQKSGTRPERSARVLAAAVAAAALLGAWAAPAAAHAADTRQVRSSASVPKALSSTVYAYTLRNMATNRCVDDSFDYGLRAFGCNGLNFQRLNFYDQGNDSTSKMWVLQDQSTGRCLDDSLAYGLRSASCNGLNYQNWRMQYWSDSSRTFINVNTGRCMDDSSAYGLRAYPCNNLTYQRFYTQ
ncbi:actinohivin [Kitasatospora sp. NA04385]|uniref:RICIN domain-containing protein n=1 Tax=Kitasatospora sp. NA04385 TaxID=2742135 RepID=UPI001592796D|nr:actinohivin [Kitasatospora sp. NA04385]QKW17685.1 actinohivin [Kitasatospora sp. NA04385]